MTWIPILVLNLAAGWFLAGALRIAGAAHRAAFSILLGPGLASMLFFGAAAAGIGTAPTAVVITLLLLAASLAAALKLRDREKPAPGPGFPYKWALLIALGIGCAFLVYNFAAATEANPNGEWDAGAIWNLRARYLAGGPATWHRALSSDIASSSHPAYPLFLSSFLALQWAVTFGYPSLVPAIFSLLTALGLLLMLATSQRRSNSLGLLAALVLVASETFSSQAAAQYSDLLLALAFLGSLLLLDTELLIAAGLVIGFAPWIKNEGQPFAIAALAVAIWRFRGRSVRVLAGAAPGILATLAVKLMAEGRETMFPATAAEALARIADPARWAQILAALGKALVDMGPLWAHPLLLAAALAIAFRFRPSAERRSRWWLAIPLAATLAAEFGIYLITAAGLGWHLSTSADRLVVQLWPAALWLFFSLLRAPEEYFAVEPAAAPESGKPRYKNRSSTRRL